MQQMASDINKMRRPLPTDTPTVCLLTALTRFAGDQLQKDSMSWLCPPDPSKNYNIGCQIHRDGTATWFFQGSTFSEWSVKGSLLWIYGKRTFSSCLSMILIHSASRSGFWKEYFAVGYVSLPLSMAIHALD